MTSVLLGPESPEPDRGSRAPSPERLEWLRLKAAADRETKAKRLKQMAKRRPLSARTPSARAYYEAQRDLDELRRDRRRWENA